MLVFVNAVPVEVGPGTAVRAAVLEADPGWERKLAAGQAFVTDARGIEVPLDATLSAGAILRVVVSARGSAGKPDADA